MAVPLLAALLLACLPAGSAEHAPTGAHPDVVEEARAQVSDPADFGQLTVDYTLGRPSEGPFEEPFCEDSEVRVDAAAGSFTFDETANGDGCAEVRIPVAIPPGAERLVVTFTANRVITDTFGNAGLQVQQFRILDGGGGILRSKDYYNATEGAQPTPENFTFDEPLGEGRATLVLSWLFDDQGFQGERLTTMQDFDATVSAIRYAWPDVRLDMPTTEQGAETARNATHAAALFRARVTLPEALTLPNMTTQLAVHTRHGATFESATGPQGPLAASSIRQVDDRTTLQVHLDAQAVAAQGAGEYTFEYESLRLLPAQPPPPEPTRITPFYLTMLLLPLPAALLALYSAIAFRREAEGRYRRASHGILAVILVGAVYYALLVLYAVRVVGKALMTELPLHREATLIYVQLIVLLLFFAVIAVVVGRYLARAMRRDIEQRRAQEERLRRSNEELERFAYVASHDLQEPLRKVAGFTSLLQRRYKGRLDKDADEMIQYAVDGATRMQALIRDILAYSRVGSSELDFKPVDVGAVMELVASDLGERIKEEKAQVVWDALPQVEADAGQLRQVLQNLVENGIKYRHPDRRPRVKVSAERDGQSWRFSVADNGVGIPADKLAEIFGIFRRLHGSDVPGTGIGLALVKKAVERHGGRVWAESRPGKGSTFHFSLPAQHGTAPALLSWRTPAGLRGPPGTDATPA